MEILTPEQAAEFLQLPKRTIAYFVATNQIPFARIGKRRVRFVKSRLLEWMMKEREGVEFRMPRKEREDDAAD